MVVDTGIKPGNATLPETKSARTCKTLAEMQESADYKERCTAEYVQTKTRYDKLHRMIIRCEAGTLNFTPSCPLELLKRQAAAMGEYLYVLEIRSEIEGFPLTPKAERSV